MTETKEEARMRIAREILAIDSAIIVLQRIRETLVQGYDLLK